MYDCGVLPQQAFLLSMVSGWARLLALSTFRVARLTIRAVTSLISSQGRSIHHHISTQETQHISPCTRPDTTVSMAVETSPNLPGQRSPTVTRFYKCKCLFVDHKKVSFSCTHGHSSEQPAPWVHLGHAYV